MFDNLRLDLSAVLKAAISRRNKSEHSEHENRVKLS